VISILILCLGHKLLAVIRLFLMILICTKNRQMHVINSRRHLFARFLYTLQKHLFFLFLLDFKVYDLLKVQSPFLSDKEHFESPQYLLRKFSVLLKLKHLLYIQHDILFIVHFNQMVFLVLSESSSILIRL